MASNSQISFYVDTLLVEAVLADPKFYKKGGVVSDLLDSFKSYFSAHINPETPVTSVLNMLAPGVMWALMNSLGLGKWGLLLGLLTDVFHVDVLGLLKSLHNKVRDMISGGQKVSSSQISEAATATAQEFSQPATPQEIQSGYLSLQQRQNSAPQTESAQSDDGKVYSSLELLHDAKMLSLALVNYEHQKMRLTKEAINFGSFSNAFSGTRAKSTSLLARIFGWIITIALSAAGLLVAGDVVNKIFGRPNALDHTYQEGKEEPAETAAPIAPQSVQDKFKLKSDAPLPRSWPLVNNSANIESMLVQFAKDTYDGLDGKESIIQSTPGFQNIKEQISWYNIHNPGSAIIFIPGIFTSKKQLVDYFIDEVARNSP